MKKTVVLMVIFMAALQVASGAILNLKYTMLFPNQPFNEPHPLMGDIDNDGVNEIVFNGGDYIYVLDGRTGSIEWRAPNSMQKAPELIDLDNDGTPEVLYAARGPRVVAMKGNGQVYWTSQILPGDDVAQFPVAGYDIDGTGSPYVYFTTEDTKPSPFSGNILEYRGALYMLDSKGKLLRSTWLNHPCFGGITIADANFDGNFEFYIGDRIRGFDGQVNSKGLQAFDAKTLNTLWSAPWLQHSSTMAVLADVQGDRNLEVVATQIVAQGPAILNAMSGAVLKNYTDRQLPTHATPTVYDFDRDGNLEAIYATSYPNATTHKEVAVFDLVTGKTDWQKTYDYWVTWPPKVGDVTGDGVMEMLIATGTQYDPAGNYPLIIVDRNFTELERRNITNAGQLTEARLYDVDKDGLQELLVAGVKGKLLVYDTNAKTSNPPPNSWVQYYSEYRRGAAEYVEPPGPLAPKVLNPNPAINAVGVSTGVTLSARIHDFQKDRMSGTIQLQSGNAWQTIGSFSNMANGQVSVSAAGRLNAGTSYRWRVVVNDGKGHATTQEYSFRT